MTINLNRNELSLTAEERYKQAVLGLLGRLRDLRPLPGHLDWMVSVVNRLSPEPEVLLGIIPHKPGTQTSEMLVHFEVKLPVQMDLPEGIRWLEDQVFEKNLDLREGLTPEELEPPAPPVCPRCKERPVAIVGGFVYELCSPCFTSNA